MFTELDGVRLITAGDNVVVASKRRKGGFERKSVKLWKQLSKLGGIMVDAGAYTGFYSILAARNGARHVHAFEANQAVHGRLYENLVDNGVTGCVTVHPFALTRNSNGKVRLRGKSSLTSAGTLNGEGPVICVAKTLALDDVNLAGTIAMKIDVERSEFNLLRGAQKTLREYKPHLLIELLDDGPVPDLLKRWGYRNCEPLDAGMFHFYA